MKRRKKYSDFLEEFENSDKKKAVREAYMFKKLSNKLKTKLGVSGSSDQVYNQLIDKRREELQSMHSTSNQLDDLFRTKQGIVEVPKSNKNVLVDYLSGRMNFKANKVLRLKIDNVYYVLGNNKNRTKLVNALSNDFETIEEAKGSDAEIVSKYKEVGKVILDYTSIKGKKSGGYFDKLIRIDVKHHFIELSTLCHIRFETEYTLVSDKTMEKNLKKMNYSKQTMTYDCLECDNCLQQSIQTYAIKNDMFTTDIKNYMFTLRGLDNVKVKDLNHCNDYNMTIHLKVYDKERTRTCIYGEGLLVIHLALINKHYIPILKFNMTSYALTNYNQVRHSKLRDKQGFLKDCMLFVNSKGKKDLSKRITTDVALDIMLEGDEFFIDNHEVYKEEDYVREDCVSHASLDLRNDTCVAREYKKKNTEAEFDMFYADFETYFSNRNLEKLTPILCCVKNEDVSNTFYGDNCGFDMLDFLLSIQTKTFIKLVFHNLKFDLSVLLSQKDKITTLEIIERGGILMSAIVRYRNQTIHFQDSYAYLTMPLSAFSKTFHLECKKEILPYNYYVKNYKEVVTIEEFKQAIRNRYDTKAEKEAKKKSIQNKTSFKTELEKYFVDIENEALDIATSFGLIHNHTNNIRLEALKTKRSVEFVKANYMKKHNLNTTEETVHMTQYNAKYCEADCVVLFEGLKAFNSIMKEQVFVGFRNLSDVKPFNECTIYDFKSISSIGDHYFRWNGVFDKVYDICGITRQFISRCSHGGRVQSCYNKKTHIKNKLISDFDGVSLYPSAMKRLSLEYGGILLGTPKILEHLTKEFLDSVDGYFVEIKITKVRKVRSFSVLGLRLKDKRLYDDTNLEGSYVHVDKITLEMMIQYNEIEYEILKGYYYNEGRSDTIGKVIEQLFDMRLEAKRQHNEGLSTTLKLLMNACYGKCGLKASDYTSKYSTRADFEAIFNNQASSIYSITELENNLIKYEKQNDVFKHYNAVHVSSEILSMSKKIMNEILFLCEDNNINAYYTDTDSIHMDYDKIEVLSTLYYNAFKKSELHNFGTLIGKKLSQFHSDFESNLLEGDLVAIETIILGAKCYVDKLTPLENVIVKDDVVSLRDGNLIDYHIRAKGINVDSILAKAKSEKCSVMKLYEDLLNNKTLEFDLSVGGEKASFKITDFNPMNNHLIRNVKFEGMSYIVYDGNKNYEIDTFLDDPEDYILKQTKMKDELRAIKRTL